MTVFTTALATLHADANMRDTVEFRRPPYAWQTGIQVIRARESEAIGGLGGRGARAGRLQVDILASQVTDTPRKGDEVRGDLGFGSRTYTVEDAAPDDLALSFRCTLSDATQP